MKPDERVYGRAETVSKLQREASHAVSIPPDAPVESLVTQFESRYGRKELRFMEFREWSLVSCKATKDGREEKFREYIVAVVTPVEEVVIVGSGAPSGCAQNLTMHTLAMPASPPSRFRTTMDGLTMHSLSRSSSTRTAE
jgi:hypothetical protein